MANLTIRISTTREEYDANDIDLSEVTPRQVIDNMSGVLPGAGQDMEWKMLRGNQVVDQEVSLEDLGFKDGDTAELMAKVSGANPS